MKKNVGTSDAHRRIVIAAILVLVALFIVEHPYLRITLALFGAVFAATAYLRTCWLYTLMGKNTCEPEATPAPASQETTGSTDTEESSGEKIA